MIEIRHEKLNIEKPYRCIVVSDIHSHLDRFKQLLKEAIDMVEYNMNVIRSTRMSSGSSNYSSDASEVAGMAPQHGLFDAKQ